MGGGQFISGLGVGGPDGAHELVNEWCRLASTTISGEVFRYRLLNHPTAMILLDSNNPAAQTRALDPLVAIEAVFSRERFMAEEINRVARRDAGPEPRNHPLLQAVWFTVPDERAEWFRGTYQVFLRKRDA